MRLRRALRVRHLYPWRLDIEADQSRAPDNPEHRVVRPVGMAGMVDDGSVAVQCRPAVYPRAYEVATRARVARQSATGLGDARQGRLARWSRRRARAARYWLRFLVG